MLAESTRRGRRPDAARFLRYGQWALGLGSVLLPSIVGAAVSSKDLGDLGTYHKWHKIQVVLPGPAMSVTGAANPFTIPVDVTFIGPGSNVTVPAFYDGDGVGGYSGNVWKVRFSAGALGQWSFTSASTEPTLSGYSGTFSVDAPPPTDPDFLRWGRLLYAGNHYLKFADGGPWLKAGIDDPENFLGTAIGDWNAKKAAVDALSTREVNSIYAITNNIDGDRNDSWPWWGSTTTEAKANSSRFDVAKLQDWEDFFTYCDGKGVAIHLVLNDDSCWHAYDSDLYYREMVARFGHHPAVIWNIGEEANEIYTNSEQVALAGKLRSIDPYHHPVTVHRAASTSSNSPVLDNQNFDLTSIQAGNGGDDFTSITLLDMNRIVINQRTASASSGRPIPVMIDETPRVTSVTSATRLKMRSQVLYPIYLAGGNFELHYYDAYWPGGSVDIQALGPMLDDMRLARQFAESMPLLTMAPNNALLSVTSGNYCLANPGAAYGIYMTSSGPVDLDLRAVSGSFAVTWYNVTTGSSANGGSLTGGAWRSLGSPPFSGDVAVRVVSTGSTPDTTAPSPPGQLRAP